MSSEKLTTSWTKEHKAFCLSYGYKPSKILYSAVESLKNNKESPIDIEQANSKLQKRLQRQNILLGYFMEKMTPEENAALNKFAQEKGII